MGKVLSPLVFGLALVAIFIAGLGFVGWLYYTLNGNPLAEVIKYSPVSQEPSSFNLQINAPEDNALVFDGNILLTGKTSPGTSVIVVDGGSTTGFEVTSNGDFSKVISLTEGAHLLTITAFDKTGLTKTVTRQVYYSKEKLEDEK